MYNFFIKIWILLVRSERKKLPNKICLKMTTWSWLVQFVLECLRIINALITDDMYPCFQPQFAVSHWPPNVDVLEHLVSREGKLHEVYTTLKCTILSHQDSTGKYFDIIKSCNGNVQKSETCFAGGGVSLWFVCLFLQNFLSGSWLLRTSVASRLASLLHLHPGYVSNFCWDISA